jgi:hypothetical protein
VARKTDEPARRRTWLLPTITVIAVLVVIAAIVYTLATGQKFL